MTECNKVNLTITVNLLTASRLTDYIAYNGRVYTWNAKVLPDGNVELKLRFVPQYRHDPHYYTKKTVTQLKQPEKMK